MEHLSASPGETTAMSSTPTQTEEPSTSHSLDSQLMPSPSRLLRNPIIPSSFYALSLAQDKKVDRSTLEQAFNVPTADLKLLLSKAAITLHERGYLGSPARSKAAQKARSEAVLEAIHSLPLFAGFFDKYIKRYPSFVASMTASIARLCNEEYRQWQMQRDQEASNAGTVAPQDAAPAPKSAIPTKPAPLPPTPAKPRKQTQAPKRITKTSTSTKKRVGGTKKAKLPLKKSGKTGSRKA